MLDIQGKNSYNPKAIKKALSSYMGKNIKIRYNLGRNKYEVYEAKIKTLYNYLFLVEINDNNHSIKSFSYADIITKTIKIYE